MTRWRPSSPVAEAPGQWGSAWTYAYPAQARIDALRRLLGGASTTRTSSPRSPSARRRPSGVCQLVGSALQRRRLVAADGGTR